MVGRVRAPIPHLSGAGADRTLSARTHPHHWAPTKCFGHRGPQHVVDDAGTIKRVANMLGVWSGQSPPGGWGSCRVSSIASGRSPRRRRLLGTSVTLESSKLAEPSGPVGGRAAMGCMHEARQSESMLQARSLPAPTHKRRGWCHLRRSWVAWVPMQTVATSSGYGAARRLHHCGPGHWPSPVITGDPFGCGTCLGSPGPAQAGKLPSAAKVLPSVPPPLAVTPLKTAMPPP